MKIKGIIIRDGETGKFTAFIRQFPGICAQADSIREVDEKVNAYYRAFMDRIKSQGVEIDESEVVSI